MKTKKIETDEKMELGHNSNVSTDPTRYINCNSYEAGMVAHIHLSCNMFTHLPWLEKTPKPVRGLCKKVSFVKKERLIKTKVK